MFECVYTGRKRILPNINSDDKPERRKAERQAVNSICQGSAADLIKVSDYAYAHICIYIYLIESFLRL